ncbi:Pentatricopeptide repeat-containing protein [Raphanus sativus]|nr:Pentatricopeptide repeat-containing protein [Raphanus sativus]
MHADKHQNFSKDVIFSSPCSSFFSRLLLPVFSTLSASSPRRGGGSRCRIITKNPKLGEKHLLQIPSFPHKPKHRFPINLLLQLRNQHLRPFLHIGLQALLLLLLPELLKLIVFSDLYQIAHSVILALVRESTIRERETLLTKLMTCFDQLRDETGFRLNYPCYISLLMSLAKLDLGLLAYLTYKRMESDGFVAGEIDYRTVINALCKNGLTEAAEMFMCKIVKIGFVLDSHVCTSLVLGFCRGLNFVDALRVFDVMSRDEASAPNSVTYSNLIHELCQVGRLEEVFVFKDKMGENGCEPSTRTYTVLIKALCDKGFSLFDEMVGKGGCKASVHTYTVLIDGLCRHGKVEEANGVFRKMVEDGILPSVVTYNALINGYCKEGRIVPAFEVLAVMEKRGCRPNVRTFNELMEGLCRVGRPFKAVRLLKRMVDDGLSPDVVSYNVLIDGLCREGLVNVVYKLLGSMSFF